MINAGLRRTVLASMTVLCTAPLAACAVAPALGAASPVGWHVDKIVRGSGAAFTAVLALGSRGALAFESPGSFRARPVEWQRIGSNWIRKPFPGLLGEQVTGVAGAALDGAWAATSKDRVLRFGPLGWHVSRRFSRAIGSVVAVSADNAWVFGEPYSPGAGLGTWHFRRGVWARIRSGNGLFGGSAVSPGTRMAGSVWAYGHSTVAHWTGKTWVRTSVAGLLPSATPLCDPHLTGVYAQSDTGIWAVGTGGCQDQLGPFVLLRYNGTSWRRLALVKRLGEPVAVVPDGSGGVWIAVGTGTPPSGSIEHYRNGRLTSATLPIGPARLFLSGASNADQAYARPSLVTYAVGFRRDRVTHVADSAVILRYGR